MDTLPVNLDAEAALIGSLLLDRDSIAAVADTVKASHFYQPKLGMVYAAVLDCYNRRIPPDLITVLDVLKRFGTADDLGGYSGLAALTEVVPTSYHVEYYGSIVKRYALSRRGIQAGGKIAALCYDTERTSDELHGDVMKLVGEITEASEDGDTSLSRVVDELYSEWEHGVEPGMSTGITSLNQNLGGLMPGDLLILAARPGIGKSSLAAQIALNIAFHQSPGSVHMFSLEMSKKQLFQRFIANRLSVDLNRIMRRQCDQGDLPRWIECAETLKASGITIDETPALSIGAVRSRLLRHIATHGRPPLVVVDYLTLLSGNGKYKDNRVVEVGDISRGLKQLAREANVPVLALAQLNRAIEHRSNQMPILSDLRESGSIEADADIVMFLSRDDSPVTPDGNMLMNLSIAKHRNGPQGIISLRFHQSTQRWTEPTSYEVPEGYTGGYR